MTRLLGWLTLSVSLAFLAPVVADDAPKKERAKGNSEALFKKLDTDGDGKVTKEEFSKLTERIAAKAGEEKAKAFAEATFKKLDANGDGVLSAEEFKNFGPGAKGGAKRKRPNEQK